MTLPRVLEPEVMDTSEEANDFNRMDHSAVNKLFAEDLFAAGFAGGDVLDVGTGTALIPVEICQQAVALQVGTNLRVMAIDLSTKMLDLARYNIEIAGVARQIQLGQVDAKRMPYPSGMFDAVISNSIVHHIPEPVVVLREFIRVVRDEGLVFIRDLIRPPSDSEVALLVKLYAGGESEHSQRMFDDSLRAALTLDEVRALVSSFGYDPRDVNATSDRHWTWSARKVKTPT
jgi:ubiquinone/menaquinone biosynthesis C-methylase UbiE